MERYNRITNKNQREIVLLQGRPCAWGKCRFCDYIDDNSRDREAMLALNRRVLSRSVEDTTTIMQVFVPWSATCVFCNALFDCTTATLASCYFIGYLNPIISIILAITGYGVFYTNGKRGWGKNKYDPAKDGPITPEQTAQYYAAQE